MKRNYIRELSSNGWINDTTLSMDKEISTLEKRVLRLEEGLKEVRNGIHCHSQDWARHLINEVLK